MKYMGSKARHAKHILPFITEALKTKEQYIEPFVGGANMIDKVPFDLKIGYDLNPHLISALNLIKDNPESLPKDQTEFTEQMYKEIRSTKEPDGLYGYAGFALSFGGKWFGGWRRCAKKIDYVAQAYRSAVKQSKNLQECTFIQSDYRDILITKPSVIYCDPPYAGTTEYTQNKSKFNHAEFWDWVRKMSDNGHSVFVSEYNAPDDFESVWQKEVSSSLDLDTGSKKAVEKLFVLRKNSSFRLTHQSGVC